MRRSLNYDISFGWVWIFQDCSSVKTQVKWYRGATMHPCKFDLDNLIFKSIPEMYKLQKGESHPSEVTLPL